MRVWLPSGLKSGILSATEVRAGKLDFMCVKMERRVAGDAGLAVIPVRASSAR